MTEKSSFFTCYITVVFFSTIDFTFTWTEKKKPWKPSVRIFSVPPEIYTWYLPKASPKLYCLSQPVRCKTQINLSVKNSRRKWQRTTENNGRWEKTKKENKRNKRTKKIKEGAEYVKSHSSMARSEGGANTWSFFLSLYRKKVMNKMITNWKRMVQYVLHETQHRPAFLMYF
jgi:hypothetical protein